MFNKSALLIILSAAFAVALPTGSIPSTLAGVHVLGVSASDVKTPSTNYAGVPSVRNVREEAQPSLQFPQVDAEKEKAPTVPKDTSSVPGVTLPQGETFVTDTLPKVDASTGSVLKNPSIARSSVPAPPLAFSNLKDKDKSSKDDSEKPDASTLKPPSSSASISFYARTQPNNTVPQPSATTPENPDTLVSDVQSTVEGAGKVTVIKGNMPREGHIPGVHMPSVPSTHESTQSSPPQDLSSFATDAATGLKSASSNVKSPSMARRAESCDSEYTLTYCRQVLLDTSVTGKVGLSCSAAKTSDNIYPLCSKRLDVQGLALDCVDAIVNSLA
ncbi:hypothetical protein DEU56DRAFT_823189 [Suillus clintonianus]|uniref:uncharacterized protein n=1 Tax=Suillus clintonianus TaxID=1904413 RepID=UPI001B869692|nr:uncharacterized protein DEU56DRAFT_823189 [Suillus clintonianus]KAG2126048.1 hypothetical protein DEU56DRAFT_823189 [Suillus clintonianus]